MKPEKINISELSKKMPILNSIDLNLCVGCKATKLLCGISYCPLLKALDLYPSTDRKIETVNKDGSMFGLTPQIFVGSNGYPRVLSGPMTSLGSDNVSLASKPSQWTELSFKEIIDIRFNLIRGKQSTYIKKDNIASARIHEKLQEITLSSKLVEVEGKFSQLSNFDFTVAPDTQPMGPSGFLQKFDITSNPAIPKKVDSIINDELQSKEQIFELYNSKFDIYYLQGILSSGSTGLKDNAKIVPTRWSITATDDMIGKELIPRLKYLPTISTIELRQGDILGNYYTVILLPGDYTFENIEAWIPGNIFSLQSTKPSIVIDREGFKAKEIYKGKSKYSKQAGGYYAARLPLLEHLIKRQRQAKVLIIREITPEYLIPVGVWEVREGIKMTCEKKPILFDTKDELILYLKDKIHLPIINYVNMSFNFTKPSLEDFF